MAKSRAQIVAELSPEERAKVFEGFTQADFDALQWDWRFWARPEQIVPEGSFIHVALAGRGFGKTRAGAEWVREKALKYPGCRIALVGRASGDTTGTIIYGESGVMSISPESEKPHHKISQRKLIWPNGSTAETFSSQEPSQLRGPQFHFALADELGSWLHTQDDSGLNAWDNLKIATRLEYMKDGVFADPQIFVATTPKRTPSIVGLLDEHDKDPERITITRGSTYDNAANLSRVQMDVLTGMYEGTAIGEQELMGLMLDDKEGALWTPEDIDRFRDYNPRVPPVPFKVIAVDPSVSENPNDECGIVVIGATNNSNIHKRHAYVIEDASVLAPPQRWAKIVAELSAKYNAPVVYEKNQGGALVDMAVRAENPDIRTFSVWAGGGKATRAEPVVMRYQQGKVHHWSGVDLSLLESQMVTWDPEVSKKSPDRVDALVWGIYATLIKPPKGMFPRRIRAKSAAHGRLPGGLGTGYTR